ncbi:putative tail fiber protein [Mammaliicoccus virus vB_MscM-PMS2]|nr:putative tail fiber protein [Mammaliicoccus virus vB_MscM-PMS2]
MAYLKAYDSEGNLIAVGEQAKGDKGYITLKNLEPHKKYEQGSFTIKWVSDDFETEGIFSPEFSTHDSEYKEFMFYTKDILKVQGLSAYQTAVKNGYTGTEEEWVQSIKGDKGDKMTFEDLSDNDKEELKGEQGLQGVRGDAPNSLKVNAEYDVTVLQPIATGEFNAMRYFRDTSNTDEFMKGYDNYVARYGTSEVIKTIKEDYSNVTKGSIKVSEGNDNAYSLEVGTTVEHTFNGYSISMTSNTGTNGGMWKASIDGTFVKNISTWFDGVGTVTTQLIADNLTNTEHTLTLEFIGQDPEHPITSPRGWIRTGKYNKSYSTFTILKKENVTGFSKVIDVAYPVSNKEYAICVRPKGSTGSPEFFPYHGTQTSFKGENYVRQLIVDGQEVDLTRGSENIQFKEARLIQKIEHKLPTDTSIRMECTFIVTFKDSKVYNDIRFKWIQPSQITSGYVFQMPFDYNWFNSVVVDLVEQVNKSDEFGSQSDFNNDNAKVYTGFSNNEVGRDYIYQCVINKASIPVDRLWLQHRDERLQKLYPQYYNMTNKEPGDIDVFSGYYEILKIKDANKIYKI